LSPEQANLLGPAVLFTGALSFIGIRLTIQGLGGNLATSNALLAGAVIALPPPLAIPAAAIAGAVRFHLENKGPSLGKDLLWRALWPAVSAAVALFARGAADSALGSPWLSIPFGCAVFLFVAGLSETVAERQKYWKRILLSQTRASGTMALAFAPASVCLALLFDPSMFGPSKATWLWAAVPLLVVAYGACERFWGPLYEDLGKKAETDQIFLRAVEALALAVDAKDSVSSGHLKRVQRYCTEIAKALNCTEQQVRTLEFGSLLHDIGKIAVPENVLTKPGRLSPLEFSRVASHVQIGAEILSAVNFPLPVAELVLCHHENWDGTGYPRKLKGEQIPLPARILSVVDAFDALTSDRPYRPALTVEEAIKQIRSRRGEGFDPHVTDTLIELLPDLEKQIQQDPRASRQSSAGRFSVQSPRLVDATQTSLTHEERIESLKQTREAAKRETGSRDFSGWYRLLATLSRSLSPQELIEFLFAPLTNRVPFDECAVLMVRDNALTPVYCTGRKADLLRNLRIPIDHSPSGWVAGHGQALLNGNPVGEHSELGLMAWLIVLKAVLVIPL
jgi:putative nucleotidyltransferase with HDIG domain